MSASNNSEHQKSLLSRVFQQPRLLADEIAATSKHPLMTKTEALLKDIENLAFEQTDANFGSDRRDLAFSSE